MCVIKITSYVITLFNLIPVAYCFIRYNTVHYGLLLYARREGKGGVRKEMYIYISKDTIVRKN